MMLYILVQNISGLGLAGIMISVMSDGKDTQPQDPVMTGYNGLAMLPQPINDESPSIRIQLNDPDGNYLDMITEISATAPNEQVVVMTWTGR